MSNSYLPSNNKPPTAIMLADDDDPYAEVANEGGGQFGKILKYNKGEGPMLPSRGARYRVFGTGAGGPPRGRQVPGRQTRRTAARIDP